jgi:PAS domain-containing protein
LGQGTRLAASAGLTTMMTPRRTAHSGTDAFFRYIVTGMRNGVLAVTVDGTLALINEEACRIFGIAAGSDAIGVSRACSICTTCPTAPRCG